MKERTAELDDRRLATRLASGMELGQPRGFLHTTYEFQPEFFETDYLPTLLGLGAWNDHHWTSRVAIERQLAALDSAAVFMDTDGYHGRPRSLRVEVFPGRGISGQRIHSKVSMIIYEEGVRLLVGSANLTEPGYRQNIEVMAVLTATNKKPQQGRLIMEAISSGREVLKPWLSKAGETVLQSSESFLENLPSEDGVRDEWFCWGGGKVPVWQQLLKQWPNAEVVRKVIIVSPFWAEETGTGPLFTLAGELRRTGCLEEGAEVHLITGSQPLTSTRWMPILPRSYATLNYGSLGIDAYAQPVDPTVLPEEIMIEGFTGIRKLHAKVVLLEGEKCSLAYFGSANFTYKGFGFGPAPWNIEAGIIMRRRGAAAKDMQSLLPRLVGEPLKLGGATQQFALPMKSERPVWPHFVQDVRLVPRSGEASVLDLVVRVAPDQIEGAWNVCSLEPGKWTAPLQAGEEDDLYEAVLSPEALELLLKDQEVRITWWSSSDGVSFPINVHPDARDTLPVSPDSKGPNEQMLLAYYQGRISYEELFPPQDDGGSYPPEVPQPPTRSSEVDTSRIQSYQIREFVESLEGLREDLKNASFSARSMRLALLGPVSPVALARMIKNQVTLQARSSVAAGFQLLEIISCLNECKDFGHYGEWKNHLNKASSEIETMLSEMKIGCPELSAGSFQRYEKMLRNDHGTK